MMGKEQRQVRLRMNQSDRRKAQLEKVDLVFEGSFFKAWVNLLVV